MNKRALKNQYKVQNGSAAEPYGTWKPAGFALALLLPVRLGIARGVLSRFLRTIWAGYLPSIVDTSVRGIRYRLKMTGNVTEQKILLNSKLYDGEELAHLKKACTNGVFVDIGANIGYYSLVLAESGARKVVAIEPHPEAIERLEFNVEINNFSDKIKILPCAVGESGVGTLHGGESLGASTLGVPSDDVGVEMIQVQRRPLRDLLNDAGVDRIDGLKIDIEGYEHEALAPFFRAAPEALFPEVIVIETCHSSGEESDAVKLLRKKGYVPELKNRSNTILRRPS